MCKLADDIVAKEGEIKVNLLYILVYIYIYLVIFKGTFRKWQDYCYLVSIVSSMIFVKLDYEVVWLIVNRFRVFLIITVH